MMRRYYIYPIQGAPGRCPHRYMTEQQLCEPQGYWRGRTVEVTRCYVASARYVPGAETIWASSREDALAKFFA